MSLARPVETSVATPSGSLRWYALLFSAPRAREALAAMFELESELRDATAPRQDHAVAHTRLQWWRAEIDRLRGGHPQHPITQALRRLDEGADFGLLHEIMSGADLEMAGLTYASDAELDAYLFRSAGALHWMAAALAAPQVEADALRPWATGVGRVVRLVEVIRDLGLEAWHGRLFIPLDLLERHGLAPDGMQSRDLGPTARAVLAELAGRARTQHQALDTLAQGLPPEAIRGQRVLASLHLALLDEIERHDFDVGRQRLDLPYWRRPLCAWRAARA